MQERLREVLSHRHPRSYTNVKGGRGGNLSTCDREKVVQVLVAVIKLFFFVVAKICCFSSGFFKWALCGRWTRVILRKLAVVLAQFEISLYKSELRDSRPADVGLSPVRLNFCFFL